MLCPKNEAHGDMQELPPRIENQGKESFKKTVWKCNYPNCEGRTEIQETQ
jgi:hypothetical protein